MNTKRIDDRKPKLYQTKAQAEFDAREFMRGEPNGWTFEVKHWERLGKYYIDAYDNNHDFVGAW